MILDSLSHASSSYEDFYEALHPSFPAAFAWLKAFDPSTPDGKYEIGGPELIAIVQRYTTAPAVEKKWESHRVHGDIQYIVSGTELIGYARRESCVVKTPYLPEKDMEIYESPSASSSTLLTMESGSFAIFLPQDAHQPGVMMEEPSSVLKVVVKFRL